ncbi:MAG: DsbA family protein [Anaerolineales bacterium]
MRNMILPLAVAALLLLPALAIASSTESPAVALPAQDEGELSTFNWPSLGLSLEYPSGWTVTSAQGFDFVIVAPHGDGAAADAAPNFMGVQSIEMGPDDTVESVFNNVLADSGVEATADTFGGVEALSGVVPAGDNGQQARLVAFTPDDITFALLIVSAPEDESAEFTQQVQSVLESAEVEPLALDTAQLNEQLQSSLAAEERLLLGEADAPLQMIEAFDFSCSHCVDYATSISRLVQDYVQTGEMQFEFLPLTFVGRELSNDATVAFYCATELGFGWDMHKAIYAAYREGGGIQAYAAENMLETAEALETDADMEEFATCQADGRYDEVIAAQAARADELGITSTPAVLLGIADEPPALLRGPEGQVITGAVNLSGLYPRLDEQLAEATSG